MEGVRELLEGSCRHPGGSWLSLGGILRDLEGSWRLPGAIWAMLEADMAKKTRARRNAQACSRWFTIVLGGYRRLLMAVSEALSNTLGSPVGGGGFNRFAHSAGPGTLDRGPLAKEPSARIRDQHGGNIASKWLQHQSTMVPIWLLNGPWRPPGGLLEASWIL